jgi:hypothetical protein
MTNAFNLVSRGVIFQQLRAANGDIVQFIPFVHALYAFESLLFYNHRNCESDVIIISSTMKIRQGDPLGGHYSL